MIDCELYVLPLLAGMTELAQEVSALAYLELE
jgi:hypothetical protein